MPIVGVVRPLGELGDSLPVGADLFKTVSDGPKVRARVSPSIRFSGFEKFELPERQASVVPPVARGMGEVLVVIAGEVVISCRSRPDPDP